MHIPWCGHGLIGHHQHIPKRSLDGNAKIQAFICPRCHDRIDNGLWSNHIKTFRDGSVHYFILDEHGKTKAERVIGEGGRGSGEAADGDLTARTQNACVDPMPRALSPRAESGLNPPRKVLGGPARIPSPAPLSDHPSAPAVVPVSVIEEHSTYLSLPEGLPYEEWGKIGQTLWQMHKAWQWWFADWWAYGERVYGELASQAIAADANYQTLADVLWVGRQFEPSRRRETLSFKHHREVAALEPGEQDELLDRAEAEGLSTRELRQLVKGNPECEHEWISVMKCKLCGKVEAYL